MIVRKELSRRLETAVKRSPITALIGPRQSGKTTLARMFSEGRETTFFDLESEADRRRLQNPEMVLASLQGLVVLDEIQAEPALFSVLRVVVDRPDCSARFLILGSASPAMIRHTSESLAGRVEFVDVPGFSIEEIGHENWERLWMRGGFPRSYLAGSDGDSMAWREAFVRTLLERDLPQLGIRIPAVAMRRFWTMLAHYHGRIWNGAELARSMNLTNNTVRSYLDILTGSFMIRQLQPWFENISKRQVKAPKIYLRDTGLLHLFLGLPDRHSLLGHPVVGASWEGFALEQALMAIGPSDAYFWATHNGAELDLLFTARGKRFGIEVKFSEAPTTTRSMHIAIEDLRLTHLWVVYPGIHSYPISDRISAWPLELVGDLKTEIA